MKAFLLLVACCVAAFTGSYLFFRPAQGVSHPGPTSSREGSANEQPLSSSPSSSNSKRHDRDKPLETLLVPPVLVESISISAFDPFDGEFTSDFQELLGLGDRELAATKEAFDVYFKAFTDVELTLATVVSAEERPGDRPGEERLRRFATVRIQPAGDRLENELQAMREQLVARLGKPRGLAATAIIGRQLGNNGKGGELVSFVRKFGQEKYCIDVTGVGDHRLRAGRFVSGPIYDAADFSTFARYRHLDSLIRR